MTIKLPENSKLSSRARFHLQTLSILGLEKSLKAAKLNIEEFGVEKGFTRASGAPYFYHTFDVSQYLINFGIKDDHTISVAELHDNAEDTWMKYDFIKKEFGEAIAEDVMLLTKDPNIDYKKDLKALHEYLIKAFSKLVTALVKTADRVHNFGTLGATPLEKQLRVALETEAHFFPLFKWAAKEYPEYAAFFLTAKTTIEPHLEKIKEQAAMKAEFERQLAEKDAQIKALREEVVAPKIQKMHDIVDSSIEKDKNREHLKEHLSTIKVLKRRNDIIERSLEFYANYEEKQITEDKGENARKALDPMSMFE